MANILLNKIISDQIKVELFVEWLLETNSQVRYFDGFEQLKCSRTDFLTYFLNFVHEEIPCLYKHGESAQNLSDSRRKDSLQNERAPVKRNLNELSNARWDVNKSASFPHLPHKNADVSNKSLHDTQTTSPIVYRCTSTPKILKMQEENTHNNGQISPISPLYRNQNSFSTPKNERQNYANRSTEKAGTLCLGDFIVNRKSSTKKKASKYIITGESNEESSKRIKPTSLSQVMSNSSFRKNGNSFNNFQDTKEVSAVSLNDSRNFLAEERLKILSRRDSESGTPVLSSKKMSNFVNAKVEVEPDNNLVTYRKELGYFVEIYVGILRNGLVLNVTNEIYFLISLLLVKHFNDGENTSTDSLEGVDFLNDAAEDGVSEEKNVLRFSDLFGNVHNTVYFAVKCLEGQIDVLKYYDKSTLNLLRRHKRLWAFSSSLAEKLGKIAEKKTERILDLPDANVQTNVCFNLDTDNRDNFPNDVAFHAFRKQRDLFYDILRIWETQHLVTGWNFSISLGGKIKSLFSLQNDPVLFVHFSRLFKSQLLSTCVQYQKEEGTVDMSFLSSIPNVDAEKLNRLNCRLVTKQSSNGINSVPLFTEHQEFYRDFITIASNHSFNKHLSDALIAEIVELNDTKFSCTDIEGIDGCVDASTRKSYVACLKSLRVLAKFLGFVESLPYKSECNSFPEKVLNFQIRLRTEVVPSFDVKKLLQDSIKQNSTVLTVPWVTKYLSMLDYVTLRLPYYVSISKILFDLQKNCDKSLQDNAFNAALLKFCLGWLFELPHFPDSEYFSFFTESFPVPKTRSKSVRCRKLDDLDVVDQNVLYMCCPFLEEIKRLLSSNASNRSVTIKHITPLTASQSSNEMAKKRLEQQLEEAFFNGQPLSVRKTVEFVSERVASACVKHICNVIVPSCKKSALGNLKDFLASWTAQHSVISPTKEKVLKTALKAKVNQMAQRSLQTLKDSCNTEVSKVTGERIPTSVAALLSVDVLPQMRDVCVAVATRTCLERVRQWVETHITVAVFTKDFNNELQKTLCPESRKSKEKPVFALPPFGTSDEHNEAAPSGFHLLERIKGLSMGILEHDAGVSERDVRIVIEEAYTTLAERGDVNDHVIRTTCTLLVDVSLLLVAHKPGVMVDEKLLERFLRVWKRYTGRIGDLFKNLFCPRNVMLLAQSCNEVEVWETLAFVVTFLVKNNVVTAEDFECLCTEFYQKDWDQDTLKNFTRFLKKFLDCHVSDGGSTGRFALLLEFLSDFCTDL